MYHRVEMLCSLCSCNDCRRRPLLGWVGKTGFGSMFTLKGQYFHYIDGGTGEKAKGQGALSSCGWARGCNRDVWAFDWTKCCEIAVYGGDNVCDDGGPRTRYGQPWNARGQNVVPYGWDFADCGYRTSLRPVLVEYACDDSCPDSHNGVCNDRMWWMDPFALLNGQTLSTAYSCAYGTDCGDCGAKNSPVMTTPDHTGGAFDTCVDYITGVPQYRNGICECSLPASVRTRPAAHSHRRARRPGRRPRRAAEAYRRAGPDPLRLILRQRGSKRRDGVCRRVAHDPDRQVRLQVHDPARRVRAADRAGVQALPRRRS